jgi:hypothetical protein
MCPKTGGFQSALSPHLQTWLFLEQEGWLSPPIFWSIAGRARPCAAVCGETPASLNAMLDFCIRSVAAG